MDAGLAWWQIVLGIVVGVILLGILVVLHELGHAITAKRNGVDVEEFGIGFPPRAKKLGKIKGTLITLNWIPIGGFTAMKGESDDAKANGTYGAATFWRKTKILFAGILVNFITAVVIFMVMAWTTGLPEAFPNQFAIAGDNHGTPGTVQIYSVVSGSPAAKAGLKENDQLISINGHKITISSSVTNLTKEFKGQKVKLEFARDGKTESKTIQLNGDNSGGKGYLGISAIQATAATIKATWSAPIVAVVDSFQFTGETFSALGGAVGNFFGGLFHLITGSAGQGKTQISTASDAVSGPIGIWGVIFPTALASGPIDLLWITGLIALGLAVMNILPIPGLDGGRWFLTALFKILKKPLTKETEATINGWGMMFLFALIALITVADVTKFL
ncbi:MAG: M50 family metallopeptidase [Candidatus Nomurabacteria bacterium]|jgi:regulator of sigma E protease|nr:M50 family metallopeptidase [Candidatus Nomurabacteria bacterium]